MKYSDMLTCVQTLFLLLKNNFLASLQMLNRAAGKSEQAKKNGHDENGRHVMILGITDVKLIRHIFVQKKSYIICAVYRYDQPLLSVQNLNFVSHHFSKNGNIFR